MFDWFAFALGFFVGVIAYTLLIYICVRRIRKKKLSLKFKDITKKEEKEIKKGKNTYE